MPALGADGLAAGGYRLVLQGSPLTATPGSHLALFYGARPACAGPATGEGP